MNAIDKRRVKNQFGRQAQTYDGVADIQRQMADHLLERVKAFGPFREILEIGCGTGYLTGKLLQAFPESQITAIDIAEAMVEQTRKRCPNPRLKVLSADGEEIPPVGAYDLIISNAVFQWFERPAETTVAWVERLTEGGVLAVATFGEQTFRELHGAYAAAAHRLGEPVPPRPGQEFPSLDWWRSQLDRGPIEVREGWQREHATYHPSARDFLRTVKAMGASNASKGQGVRRGLLTEMVKGYDREYGTPWGTLATYHEVGFVIHKKPL